MPAVSNTSPLLNLAIIDRLDLLWQQVDHLVVPEAVRSELQLQTERPGTSALRKAFQQERVTVEHVQDRALVRVLRRDLDVGEAEAIALAVERQAELILLDEREGRAVARTLNLRLTGVLGVLLKARRNGELASLGDAMQRLREEAGFWIAPSLEARLLRAAGEAAE